MLGVKVNYRSGQMTCPGYTVSSLQVNADIRYLRISVVIDHDFPVPPEEGRRIGNVMAWVDGILTAQMWGYYLPGQTATYNYAGNQVVVIQTVDLSVNPLLPGLHMLTLSLWPQTPTPSSPLPYIDYEFTVPPRPRPSLAVNQFIRCLFWTDPEELLGSPESLVVFQSSGVSHLTTGVFRNPVNSGNSAETYEDWHASWFPWLSNKLTLLEDHGFRLIAAGDDLMSTMPQRDWYNDTAWAEQATIDLATLLRDSGVCDAMAVVDEIGGSPDDHPSFKKFVNAWRSVEGAPLLGWPAPGVANPPFPFERSDVSDYADRYWANRDFRAGREDGSVTLSSICREIWRASQQTEGRPWLCLAGAMGAYYTKLVEGPDYQAGRDDLQKGGMRGQDIPGQVWAAIALGAAGVRVYAYDQKANSDSRRLAAIGTKDLQTGMKPGDDRWSWLVSTFLSVVNRESEIVNGHCYPPYACGPVIVGRRGKAGVMINTASIPVNPPIPLGPAAALIAPYNTVSVSGDIPPGGVVLWDF